MTSASSAVKIGATGTISFTVTDTLGQKLTTAQTTLTLGTGRPQPMSAVLGSDIGAMAAMIFPVPSVKGSYKLALTVTDALGCQTTSPSRSVTVK